MEPYSCRGVIEIPEAARSPGEGVAGWGSLGGVGWVCAALSLLLSGCGTLVGVHPPPEPVPVPGPVPPPFETPTPPPPLPVAFQPQLLPPPKEVPAVDPILDSPWATTPEMEARVQEWVVSLRTREAPHLAAALARMGLYREAVDEEIRRQGLPASLAYLPIVESWYSPTAVSWVGAAGLWQFMAPTARGMGLKVNRLVDERRDPFLATPQALSFLGQLREQFGSWFLALAAYNGGPGRVERLLRNRAPEGEGHDGLFLEILRELPRETRDFVPRFLAAGRIAREVEAFGFGEVKPMSALAFEEVDVPDATSLDVVARAAGVELEAIQALNPQFLRGLTPAGVSTRVRVPLGAGEGFSRGYAAIPPQERVTFVEHAVAQGETLTHIGLLYGVPVEDIQAANPAIEPRRMQIGQRVIVPKAPSAREGLRAAGGVTTHGSGGAWVYRVQSGDTLGGIAARHRVSIADLLRWNGLSINAIIRPGDEVKVRPVAR